MRHSLFIDSNVWFSAFYRSGTCSELIQKSIKQGSELYISELVLEEVIRNLELKLPHAMQNFIDYIHLHDVLVLEKPSMRTLKKYELLADKEDFPILVSAIESPCEFFITGNIKDFQVKKIASKHNLSVLTPAQYLKVMDVLE
ncbi:putative toxin-antitoxin system toxin component, PIN family [Candidatus Woesebacteria bacterium]|nr:putative toxin-antitoxin system toxin component, PIN family [Candidatus Woesebacteria bacterium]